MAQTTQGLGLQVFDFATDSTPSFVNGVAGLEDSNMHKIDRAITDKVKINNVPLNASLIENKVVQSGLDNNPSGAMEICTMNIFNKEGVVFTSDRWITDKINTTINIGYRLYVKTNRELWVGRSIPSTTPVISWGRIATNIKDGDIIITFDTGTHLKVYLNDINNLLFDKDYIPNNTLLSFVHSEVKSYVYNRFLSLEEIQHNLSILNNSASINKINDYAISTDTDHIEDRTGRTAEQINRVFYKQNCKEFTSNGEAISVNNGMDGYVLSGKIEGNTIKNYCKTQNITLMGLSTTLDVLKLLPNTKYTLILNVKNMDGNSTVRLRFVDTNGTNQQYYPNNSGVMLNLGINKIEFTTNDLALFPHSSNTFYRVANDDGKLLECDISIIEGDGSRIKTTVPFGLSSTQAVVYNNQLKYSFYMPTIDGKTKVMKSLKGANSWVEIDASEARDTAKYDYKLENTTSDLGSTPSVSDYIDRARKVKVVNTKEIVFNGNQAVYTYKQSTNKDYSYFRVVYDNNYVPVNGSLGISTYSYAGLDVYGMYYNTCTTCAIWITGDGFYVSVPTSKLSDYSAGSFKTYLQTNPITLRYKLATPIEIPMTDEEIKAYDAYKKVILLPYTDDKIALNEDGSGTWVDATNKIIINGSENWIIGTDIKTNTRNFMLNIPIASQGWAIADKYSVFKTSPSITDEVGIYVGVSQPRLYLSFPKSIANDVDAFKAYLAQNNFTLEYQAETPIVTTIDKSIMPTILTQATNTFTFGDAVAPYKATISAPVNRIADLETRLAQVEKVIASTSNVSLLTNYVDDVYNNNQNKESEVM